MFTGIIREMGRVVEKKYNGGNVVLGIKTTDELDVADSVAINGVCLTVVDKRADRVYVEVMSATLRCTNLGELRVGDEVNIEPALRLSDRLSGHLVTGHVDGVGRIMYLRRRHGYYEMKVKVDASLMQYMVPKGSIAMDGISLTIAGVKQDGVIVNITPYTLENTNLKHRRVGDKVNIEVDVLAKLVKPDVKRVQV